MFRDSRQALALLACSGILIAIIAQLNHALAPLALTVSAPGLLIAYAALRLPTATGLAVVLFSGLWLDAAAMTPFGRQAALLGIAFGFLHNAARRLPHEETLVGVVSALFVNLALFVLLAVIDLGALPDSSAGAQRLLADLILSQVFTALTGPWFLALQNGMLTLAGAPPAKRARRPV
ncbi:hypothetical protein EBZ70_04085 [bacterium]|nr:hypothetical protein [bacterium]